jgi:glutaminyl-tRNA synthetase
VNDPDDSSAAGKLDFIRQKVVRDLDSGKFDRVVTRFPPEPNGYLHVGHAKAIWTSYGIARDFDGEFHLRFDDTNPVKEEAEFVEAIKQDVAWLGCHWGEHLYFASDYFEQMYDYAVELVRKGMAYVDDLSAEEIREYRGTLTAPGRESPFRGRSVEENLDLFERMRAGEFADGSRVLRAKIDMAHPNMNMRDPVMYRILHAPHPRRGEAWCIYPMYDWAHGLEDSIEGITHSLCSIEFENHRPLYDWFIDAVNEARPVKIHKPEQTEFARYNITYTAMSKRYLRPLVESGAVRGWDDPRLPTLCALRRRGYTPEAIRDFSMHTGISKYPAVFDVALLEHFLRQDLNRRSPRAMGVLRPLKVVIENYPEGQAERLEASNNPEDPSAGTRQVPFSRELYIEREDFMEAPPRKFYRLAPGREVRLRYAYFVTCREAVKDAAGEVMELRCTYDPATRGGDAPDGRKVKSTLHWVSAAHAVDAEVRLYERLFTREDPTDVAEGEDWRASLNGDSLTALSGCKVEPSVAGRPAGWRCQFERMGYFCMDPDSTPGRPVLNRTVTLKDTWKKIQKKQGGD